MFAFLSPTDLCNFWSTD